jgi:hypothetical protein
VQPPRAKVFAAGHDVGKDFVCVNANVLDQFDFPADKQNATIELGPHASYAVDNRDDLLVSHLRAHGVRVAEISEYCHDTGDGCRYPERHLDCVCAFPGSHFEMIYLDSQNPVSEENREQQAGHHAATVG